MTADKPQLSEEQRQQLKAIVIAQIREKLSRRDELQEQATVMRELWAALVASPTWSIVQGDKPPDLPSDEIWSMVPTVTKR